MCGVCGKTPCTKRENQSVYPLNCCPSWMFCEYLALGVLGHPTNPIGGNGFGPFLHRAVRGFSWLYNREVKNKKSPSTPRVEGNDFSPPLDEIGIFRYTENIAFPPFWKTIPTSKLPALTPSSTAVITTIGKLECTISNPGIMTRKLGGLSMWMIQNI